MLGQPTLPARPSHGRRPRRSVLLVVVGASLLACRGPDTVVLVVVEGQTPRPTAILDVGARIGSTVRNLSLTAPSGPIDYPTSFTLQIPSQRSGSLRVSVSALDEAGVEMTSGTATVTRLANGKLQDLRILLGTPGMVVADAGVGIDDDAGMDAPLDARGGVDAPRDTMADGAPDLRMMAPDTARTDLLPADAGADAADARPIDAPGDVGVADGRPDATADAVADGAAPDAAAGVDGARLDGGPG